MQRILELTSVTKHYGTKAALEDVSVAVEPGVVGLLGPNGSGKSTLIKLLLGLARPTRGSIRVLGLNLPRHIRTVRDRVGYMPEDDCFISGLSGIESMHTMARLSGLPSLEGLRRSHEVLDFAEMGQERYRAVETYSTGMRQKLKFAQALVHDPALLIFDEPTTGLDPEQRLAMLKKIGLLARRYGKSILLSTHILHDVREVCDSVIILSRGRIRVVDSLERLSRPERVGMQVSIAGDAGNLANELWRRGLDSDREAFDTLWVYGVEESHTQPIWQAAETVKASITRLAPAINPLEKVFFEAIRESEHALA
jgi:ABC-2 type transport system ATP-binding protein